MKKRLVFLLLIVCFTFIFLTISISNQRMSPNDLYLTNGLEKGLEALMTLKEGILFILAEYLWELPRMLTVLLSAILSMCSHCCVSCPAKQSGMFIEI